MPNLGILLALLLLVGIALSLSLPQAQVLESMCQCSYEDVSVLICPIAGDTSVFAETDGLPCFTSNVESALSACFAIYANPEKAIECPARRAPMPPKPPNE
jgi:hypothetical protein